MMSPSYPILYSFRRCPYAIRARMALAASAQVCQLREVILAKKPESFLLASAKGTVPVLITAEGRVLEQSLDIMMWALLKNDPLKWMGDGDSPAAQMLELIEQCDGEFKFHLDRYKYPNRFDLCDAATNRDHGARFLVELNRRLRASRFLMGPSESLADIAIAPFIRQFAHTDPAWFSGQTWPALQSWLAAFERSSAFEQVMQKYRPWLPGQAIELFPNPISDLSPGHIHA